MPKRTNDFQGLIKLIYDQIVPEGGVVTESGMVLDKDAGILREVDILVEYKYAGHPFKFIVECRNHSRKQTIEWIDGLIGKTKSLDVNKVIAVSSKGFHPSAIRKANENNIETFTLEQANDTNWGEFPFKPGIVLISNEIYKINNVFYKSKDKFIDMSELNLESQVQIDSENKSTLKGLVENFFHNFITPQIEQYKKDNFLKLFQTREDTEKTLIVESEHNWPEVTASDKNGNLVTFSNVKYVVFGTRTIADVEQEHKVFNNKVISLGKHQDIDGTKYDFTTIQDPDTQKLHINWARKK